MEYRYQLFPLTFGRVRLAWADDRSIEHFW